MTILTKHTTTTSECPLSQKNEKNVMFIAETLQFMSVYQANLNHRLMNSSAQKRSFSISFHGTICF
jgi:hypothetical protein